MRMLMALLVLSFLPAEAVETLPPGFPRRAGPMLLCRAGDLARADLPQADLDWVSQFRLVVTNGYEYPAARTVKAGRDRGCRILRYFWANGFTALEAASTSLPDGDWRSRLVRENPDWLLSPEPLSGPAGTPPSYYFDLAQPDLVEFLARLLARIRKEGGYGGIFLDYAGAGPLPEPVLELWRRRHPDLAYDRALAVLFRRLRRTDPAGLIFTNGACLGDPALLPTVDYDMVESYGTSFLWGPVATAGKDQVPLTYRRPWSGPGGIRTMYPPLLARPAASRPRKALLCLDYMRPAYPSGGAESALSPERATDVDAVYYSYCAAAVWGLDSFCSGWYGVEYRGPLYSADLGKPLGESPVESGGLVLREYERGLVVLTSGPDPGQAVWRLQTKGVSALHDLMTGERLVPDGGTVSLRLLPAPNPLTGAREPLGRVFLKLRK